MVKVSVNIEIDFLKLKWFLWAEMVRVAIKSELKWI